MRMQAIRRSISSKFMLAVLATTCAALLVSGASMLAYDIQVFRNTWVNDLETQSAILARISVATLEFADNKVARENLTQLQARSSVLAAAIYTPDGAVFASYLRDPASGRTLPP
ncbi:MAG: hybrid sensor histidine kinase/response regulator, partial [Herminiimonas sp.]|nr:hybrid sensor histidine kinase/response regulator [Herminiimonas sp.]